MTSKFLYLAYTSVLVSNLYIHLVSRHPHLVAQMFFTLNIFKIGLDSFPVPCSPLPLNSTTAYLVSYQTEVYISFPHFYP